MKLPPFCTQSPSFVLVFTSPLPTLLNDLSQLGNSIFLVVTGLGKNTDAILDNGDVQRGSRLNGLSGLSGSGISAL